MEEMLCTGLYGGHKTLVPVASPPCTDPSGAGSTQDSKHSQETRRSFRVQLLSYCCLWGDCNEAGAVFHMVKFTPSLPHYPFSEGKISCFPPHKGWRICPTQACKQFLIPPCAEEWVITNLCVSLKRYWAFMHHPKTSLTPSRCWEEAEEAFLPHKSLWEQRSRPEEAPVAGRDPVPQQTAPACAECHEHRAGRVYGSLC